MIYYTYLCINKSDKNMQQDNLNETFVTIAGAKTYSRLSGNINDLKDIAVELRKLAADAGTDLSGSLNDALFQIETGYQAFHGLDENDFDVINNNSNLAKVWTKIEHNGVEFNCREIRDFDADDETTIIIGTTELCLSLQEEYGLALDDCPLDEEIAYYANEDEIELSDRELFDLIYN